MSDKRIPPMSVFKDGEHWRIADADAMRKIVDELGYAEFVHVGHAEDYDVEVSLSIAPRIGIRRTYEVTCKLRELGRLLSKRGFTVIYEVPDKFGMLVVDSPLLRAYEDCYADLDGFAHGSL